MKRECLNVSPPSEEELKNLEKLHTLIEHAIADGKLSQAELETIKATMNADGKITFEELELCQHLIWEKVQQGELEFVWS